MTTALCTFCGDTKFGATVPCGACGEGPTGDDSLDILLSEHRMDVPSLERLGGVVRSINEAVKDPLIRFWTFIDYLSDHPADLLSVTLPEEAVGEVKAVRAAARLPVVELDIEVPPPGQDGNLLSVRLPAKMLAAFQAAHAGRGLVPSEICLADGRTVGGDVLMAIDPPVFAYRKHGKIETSEVAAIRPVRHPQLGGPKNAKWINAEGESVRSPSKSAGDEAPRRTRAPRRRK